MIKINKLLFPTDFSRCSDQALSHALYIAEKSKAELHILNVVILFDKYSYLTADTMPDSGSIEDQAKVKMDEQLEKFSQLYDLSNIMIIKKQGRGISEAPAIMEYAADEDIDLIVMGTHGRRGLGHLFLGSVTEEITRRAIRPVFSVREVDNPKPVGSLNKILVPVDFSEHSKKAFHFAKEIGKIYNTELQVLHVIEDDIPAVYSLSGKTSIFDLVPDIEDKTKNKMEQFIIEAGGADIPYKIFTKVGHPANDIINFAADNSSDLIVIATHGSTGLEHFLVGSVTEKVVRRSAVPVFTVKAFGKSLIGKYQHTNNTN